MTDEARIPPDLALAGPLVGGEASMRVSALPNRQRGVQRVGHQWDVSCCRRCGASMMQVQIGFESERCGGS